MPQDEEFIALYNEAISFVENNLDLLSSEPYFFKLLLHIKSHPDNKDFYVCFFSEIIEKSKNDFGEVIAFCMRELRWKEIYDAAERKIAQYGIPQCYSASIYFNEILEAYEDDWCWLNVYRYYGGVTTP